MVISLVDKGEAGRSFLVMQRGTWLPALALVGAMALWGGSFPAFKYTLAHFDGWFVVWARLAMAAALGLLVLPFLRKPQWLKGDWKWLAFMILCEPCLYFVFEKHALLYTSAAQAGVIVALLPLMVAAAAAVFLQERLTRRVMFGMALAFVGAVWVSFAGAPTTHAPNPLWGNLLELLAMVCATGYTIAIKKLSARWHPWQLVAIQNGAGVIFFLPFMTWSGGIATLTALGRYPLEAWLMLAFLGSVVSFGAFLLYTFGLQKIPASRASIYSNLIPVFAVAFSISLLGERLTVSQFLACGVILGGLLISQTKGRSQIAFA